MKLCRVKGNVVATVKHPAFAGQKLMVVQPIDEQGADQGASFLAVDGVQAGPGLHHQHRVAGPGDTVLVMQEGNGVRQILRIPRAPIRSLIVGIVDQIDVARRA